MRLIDADALEQIITEKFKAHYGNTVYQFIRNLFTFVIRQIRKAPTIEAEPVKYGRWIVEKEPDGTPYCFHCSVCDDEFRRIDIRTKHPYCPNCGAKMCGGAE